jgi:hypothetical protein
MPKVPTSIGNSGREVQSQTNRPTPRPANLETVVHQRNGVQQRAREALTPEQKAIKERAAKPPPKPALPPRQSSSVEQTPPVADYQTLYRPARASLESSAEEGEHPFLLSSVQSIHARVPEERTGTAQVLEAVAYHLGVACDDARRQATEVSRQVEAAVASIIRRSLPRTPEAALDAMLQVEAAEARLHILAAEAQKIPETFQRTALDAMAQLRYSYGASHPRMAIGANVAASLATGMPAVGAVIANHHAIEHLGYEAAKYLPELLSRAVLGYNVTAEQIIKTFSYLGMPPALFLAGLGAMSAFTLGPAIHETIVHVTMRLRGGKPVQERRQAASAMSGTYEHASTPAAAAFKTMCETLQEYARKRDGIRAAIVGLREGRTANPTLHAAAALARRVDTPNASGTTTQRLEKSADVMHREAHRHIRVPGYFASVTIAAEHLEQRLGMWSHAADEVFDVWSAGMTVRDRAYWQSVIKTMDSSKRLSVGDVAYAVERGVVRTVESSAYVVATIGTSAVAKLLHTMKACVETGKNVMGAGGGAVEGVMHMVNPFKKGTDGGHEASLADLGAVIFEIDKWKSGEWGKAVVGTAFNVLFGVFKKQLLIAAALERKHTLQAQSEPVPKAARDRLTELITSSQIIPTSRARRLTGKIGGALWQLTKGYTKRLGLRVSSLVTDRFVLENAKGKERAMRHKLDELAKDPRVTSLAGKSIADVARLIDVQQLGLEALFEKTPRDDREIAMRIGAIERGIEYWETLRELDHAERTERSVLHARETRDRSVVGPYVMDGKSVGGNGNASTRITVRTAAGAVEHVDIPCAEIRPSVPPPIPSFRAALAHTSVARGVGHALSWVGKGMNEFLIARGIATRVHTPQTRAEALQKLRSFAQLSCSGSARLPILGHADDARGMLAAIVLGQRPDDRLTPGQSRTLRDIQDGTLDGAHSTPLALAERLLEHFTLSEARVLGEAGVLLRSRCTPAVLGEAFERREQRRTEELHRNPALRERDRSDKGIRKSTEEPDAWEMDDDGKTKSFRTANGLVTLPAGQDSIGSQGDGYWIRRVDVDNRRVIRMTVWRTAVAAS